MFYNLFTYIEMMLNVLTAKYRFCYCYIPECNFVSDIILSHSCKCALD